MYHQSTNIDKILHVLYNKDTVRTNKIEDNSFRQITVIKGLVKIENFKGCVIMGNRYDDIRALLFDAGANIILIESSIKKARYDASVREVLKPKIKSSLEHFRSCLEYCAQDIFEELMPNEYNADRMIYFPYGSDEETFRKRVKKNLTEKFISMYPEIYSHIESIQAYKVNDTWLDDLCDRTNTMKHRNLTNQNRADGISIGDGLIKIDNTSTGILQNVEVSGSLINHFIYKDGKVVSDFDFESSEIKIENWTEFRFEGTNVCILEFLKKVHRRISDFVIELYRLLSMKNNLT